MLWLHQRPSNKSEGDSILLSREMHYWLLSVQPCPGQLVDYPSSTACRIAVLGDNSIVEQTVTPSNLCAAKNIHRLDSGLVTCSLSFPYPLSHTCITDSSLALLGNTGWRAACPAATLVAVTRTSSPPWAAWRPRPCPRPQRRSRPDHCCRCGFQITWK